MNEKEVFMNYKRNNKWLGIIDYKSLTFLVGYLAIIWNIINLLNIPLEYKMYILILLSIPVTVMLCLNINSESAIDVAIIIIKFNFKNKIYVSTNHLYVKDVDKTNKIFLKSNKKD
ncbi:MAG: hypothetical protein PHD15_01970 [Clostridia bacterium]|nr:hypothetical protein [Clostridia bacterium]MDD4386519.1 hypothetical protein [Clostridia bacterium]